MIANAGNRTKFTIAIGKGNHQFTDLELLQPLVSNLLYRANAMPSRFLHVSLRKLNLAAVPANSLACGPCSSRYSLAGVQHDGSEWRTRRATSSPHLTRPPIRAATATRLGHGRLSIDG